mmetsp:Transcript_21882/g.25855  ORF Transcript_21882/g.25855 Transcript_21882/m.25855 type:complete len:304 (+) Transcript_21882:133-1044(+)|eukprot:CAMPEP_0114348852 /NCGR_PEP_ID=MMETSP0101-20121206/15058_1 /TAXON_ID=38822 ORGANISM="Pteridomonas danica, Strain PT" /NCGR_SAMPLE_ID=MMETSP0101 /ASSEMBLY_ACC=CAM_ASM_000211 /LENGTH=303 /DNA_ID=CAMNT_0001487063 /DNA_START=85 /DNA_END=996 /DNA_ORIENTATION=-
MGGGVSKPTQESGDLDPKVGIPKTQPIVVTKEEDKSIDSSKLSTSKFIKGDDSILIAKARQKNEDEPHSKFLKGKDSFSVTKTRRASAGSDNLNPQLQKIASINAELQRRQSMKKNSRSNDSNNNSFDNSFNNTDTQLEDQQINPKSPTRRGSLKTSSNPNQIDAHVQFKKLVDPEGAAILEAKNIATSLYAQTPLSPGGGGGGGSGEGRTLSTRRGSLGTSFESDQNDAHIKLLSEVDPIAAENLKIRQSQSQQSQSPSPTQIEPPSSGISDLLKPTKRKGSISNSVELPSQDSGGSREYVK